MRRTQSPNSLTDATSSRPPCGFTVSRNVV
jgi:hypothetical protein